MKGMRYLKRLVAVNWNEPTINFEGKTLNQMADEVIDKLPKEEPSDKEKYEAINDVMKKELHDANEEVDQFERNWKENEMILKNDIDDYFNN